MPPGPSFRGREAEPGTHKRRGVQRHFERLRRSGNASVYGFRAPLRGPGMTQEIIDHGSIACRIS